MLQKLIIISILSFYIRSYSQESNIIMESDGALPIQYVKLMDNFDNVYNYGLAYNFYQNSAVSFGFRFNTALYTSKDLLAIDNTRIYSLSPAVFAAFNLKSLPKFRPYLQVSHTTFLIADGPDSSSEQSIDTVLGLMIDITPQVYAKLEYGFTKIQSRGNSKVANDGSMSGFRIGSGFQF